MLNKFSEVHLQKQHKVYKKTFACDLCDVVHKTKGQIRHHMLQHMKSTPFSCPICHQGHTDAVNFRNHLKVHKFLKNCEICSKPLKASNIDEHMKKHLKENTFVCGFEGCESKFNNATALKTHSLTHTQPFQCGICSKRYGNKSLYAQHILLHENPNAFKCKFCDKTFNIKPSMQAHIRLHHKNGWKWCITCNARMASNIQLKIHMKTHGKFQETI